MSNGRDVSASNVEWLINQIVECSVALHSNVECCVSRLSIVKCHVVSNVVDIDIRMANALWLDV